MAQRRAIEVRIAATSGSAPREAGASMRVSLDDFEGTIGGGALEFEAIRRARELLSAGSAGETREWALGPALGQCCGGRVTLAFTYAEDERLARAPEKTVLIFGAGHVGCALALAVSRLPVALSVVDQRDEWLAKAPSEARRIASALPEAEVAAAPPGAAFVVLTHDHALDFLIAEAALARGDAAYVGMIGSRSKRARLAARLKDAGLTDAGLTCPIGAGGSSDKRPEIIAAATAAEIAAALF